MSSNSGRQRIFGGEALVEAADVSWDEVVREIAVDDEDDEE